jgi:2-amino-4-hydroxy-6-hydroxymethyldihydropteridine diphosphokinase
MMMMRRRRRSRQGQYGACTRRLDQLLTISSGLLCCSPAAAWSGLLRQLIIPSSSLRVPLSTSSSTEATGGGGFAAAGNDQQQQQPPLGTADVLLPSSEEILFQHQDVVRAETPQVAAAAAEEVVIAIGGNIGDRVQNFNKALEFMRNSGIQVIRHACLYESAPAYVTDQPVFLNSAVAARTKLDPHALLSTLKQIESELGRASGGIRYGPRPLDLDIIFYGDKTVNTERLQIPHARFMERPFVLAPLVDLARPASSDVPGHWLRHSTVNKGGIANAWNQMGGEACVGKEGLRRVIPVGSKLLDWATRTHVMGILNVTPDSFSDGGRYIGCFINCGIHVFTSSSSSSSALSHLPDS